MEEITTNVKPGIKTTEFWVSMAAVVFLSLTSIYSDEKWAQLAGVIGTSLVAAGYGFSRTGVKK
jgi:hypothetical protein